ncbi:uncharacterized protein LOC117306128 [Asterias rubens]|uniref:uncharacterized protein LOC117306128 n=1 Tax=Asterias rubens TaxID=7604 RepID=UPI001455B5FF|nr:uncharacterized protein LOC117306128 [Asterias rubens]
MSSEGTLKMQKITQFHTTRTVCFVCQKLTDSKSGSSVFSCRGRLDIRECLKKYVCLDVTGEAWICRCCKLRLQSMKKKVDEFRKSVLDGQRNFRQQELSNQSAAIRKNLEVIAVSGTQTIDKKAKDIKDEGKSQSPQYKPTFRTIFPKSEPVTKAHQQEGSTGQIAECPPKEDEPTNAVDHCYALKKGQKKEFTPAKEVQLLQGVLVRKPTLIDRAQYHCLLSAMQSKSTDIITTELLRIPALRQSFLDGLSDELGSRPDKQRSHRVKGQQKNGQPSVLMINDFLELKMHSCWDDIICEFIQKYPELVEILVKIMLGPGARRNAVKVQQLIPKLATVYGIVLQHRNHELSRIQRLVGCLFADNVVEQKVYDRMNKLGICSSYNRMFLMKRGAAALCIPGETNAKKRKAQKYAGTPGFSEIGEQFDRESDVVRRAR